MEIRKKIKYRLLAPVMISGTEAILGRRGKNTHILTDRNLDFIILGSGRNGSTLLGLLLNNHSSLFLPPEQFALPYSIMKWRLHLHKDWKEFCRIIIKDFSQSNANWDLHPEDFQHIVHNVVSLDPIYQNVGNIYREIYHYYSNKIDGKATLSGDHSPIMTTFFHLIAPEFPTTKYIFLVRHPLDVVLSHLKMEGRKTLSATQAANKWNNSIKIYEYLKNNNPGKVLLIKYEDLILSTGNEMQKIAGFLDIPFEEEMTRQKAKSDDDVMRVGKLKHHTNLYKPLFTDSINKWQREMDIRLVKQITPTVTPMALKIGYDF